MPKTHAPEYRLTCKNCQKQFTTTRPNKVYCSPVCYERQMGRNAYANRKARKNGDSAGQTDSAGE